MSARLAAWLYALLFAHVAMKRPPNFIIGERLDPYVLRWWLLPRNPFFNVYLHCFMRSDDARALHDHPWRSLSLALHGQVLEHTIDGTGAPCSSLIAAGTWRHRAPQFAHRLELLGDPCWTLLLRGPNRRAWGFHCPKGWVPWQVFTDTTSGQSINGKGCE